MSLFYIYAEIWPVSSTLKAYAESYPGEHTVLEFNDRITLLEAVAKSRHAIVLLDMRPSEHILFMSVLCKISSFRTIIVVNRFLSPIDKFVMDYLHCECYMGYRDIPHILPRTLTKLIRREHGLEFLAISNASDGLSDENLPLLPSVVAGLYSQIKLMNADFGLSLLNDYKLSHHALSILFYLNKGMTILQISKILHITTKNTYYHRGKLLNIVCRGNKNIFRFQHAMLDTKFQCDNEILDVMQHCGERPLERKKTDPDCLACNMFHVCFHKF